MFETNQLPDEYAQHRELFGLPKYVSVEQAAEILGCTLNWVYVLCRAGHLTYKAFDQRISARVTLASIAQYQAKIIELRTRQGLKWKLN